MSIVEFADGYIDPRAHSIGDRVERRLVDSIGGLGAVPESVATWCDAVAVDAIGPTDELPALGALVFPRGTRVEIKAARQSISNGDREPPGRIYVKRSAHQRLKGHRGVYLVAVYGRDGVEAARWVPAWSMDRLLRDRWYGTPDERSEGQVAQLQWPHIVDPMVV